MIDKSDPSFAGFAEIVEDNITLFVEELRGIDLVDLVSFIRFESFPTVEDLVNSSTELCFKAESLVFAWAAGVDLRWDALPVVTLGLEFRQAGVTVFFNLTLREADHHVEILGIDFDAPRHDPRGALQDAFAAASLPTGGSPIVALAAARRTGKGLRWR